MAALLDPSTWTLWGGPWGWKKNLPGRESVPLMTSQEADFQDCVFKPKMDKVFDRWVIMGSGADGWSVLVTRLTGGKNVSW